MWALPRESSLHLKKKKILFLLSKERGGSLSNTESGIRIYIYSEYLQLYTSSWRKACITVPLATAAIHTILALHHSQPQMFYSASYEAKKHWIVFFKRNFRNILSPRPPPNYSHLKLKILCSAVLGKHTYHEFITLFILYFSILTFHLLICKERRRTSREDLNNVWTQ